MIVFDKVRIAYKDRPVLNDVTLKIEDGEFFVLIGSSGCGKTTLLKSINKLLPLKSGSLSINGIPVKDVTVQDLPKMVGYVVQSGGLFPHMTVEEKHCSYYADRPDVKRGDSGTGGSDAADGKSRSRYLPKSVSFPIVWWAATTSGNCSGICG